MAFQSIANSGAQTVFGNLFAQGQVSQNMFAFYLDRYFENDDKLIKVN